MFSDRQKGATQSRLKTARTSRAALSLGFRRCCCAFSESVCPEITELFLAALDRSTSKDRPNLDEYSVSQWDEDDFSTHGLCSPNERSSLTLDVLELSRATSDAERFRFRRKSAEQPRLVLAQGRGVLALGDLRRVA